MGAPASILVLIGSWLLVAAWVTVLAVYRLILTRRDHRISRLRPAGGEALHHILQRREQAVDRWGMALTIGAVLYGIGLVLFVAYKLYDAVIDAITRVVSIL
jgi:hypothetical protein